MHYIETLGSHLKIFKSPTLELHALRLVSTPDNFPQDGNGQESFVCLVSSRSELMALI